MVGEAERRAEADRLTRLEARLDEMATTVEAVRQRLQALETSRAATVEKLDDAPSTRAAAPELGPIDGAPAGASPVAPAAMPPRAATGGTELLGDLRNVPSARLASLLGRMLMALSGAYLLRALTETAAIPDLVGVGAGLAYAAAWLMLADRAAAHGRRPSAWFHAAVVPFIACPLVWEATARFEMMTPTAAAAVLLVLGVAGVAIALLRRLDDIAWLITASAVGTAIGVALATRDLLPFLASLATFAVFTEALAFRDRALVLRWVPALGTDALLLAVVLLVGIGSGAPSAFAPLPTGPVVALALGVPLLHMALVTARCLLRGRPVSVFDIAQTALSSLVGFGGATLVLSNADATLLAPGIAGLVVAASGYAIAGRWAHSRSGRDLTGHYFATAAGLFALLGAGCLASGSTLVAALALLAAIAAALARRADGTSLRYHAPAFALATAGASGLFPFVADAFAGAPGGPWRALPWPGYLALGVAAGGYVHLCTLRDAADGEPTSARIPRALLAVVIGAAVAALAIRAMATPLANAPGPEADPGTLATVRSGAIAGLIVLLAVLGTRLRLPELTALAYPVLLAGGVKFLLEDFRRGSAIDLFLALILFGGALSLAAWLPRRHANAPLDERT